VSEPSEIKPNLVDRTCKLLKWLCNYRRLHNTLLESSYGNIPSCSWPNHSYAAIQCILSTYKVSIDDNIITLMRQFTAKCFRQWSNSWPRFSPWKISFKTQTQRFSWSMNEKMWEYSLTHSLLMTTFTGQSTYAQYKIDYDYCMPLHYTHTT